MTTNTADGGAPGAAGASRAARGARRVAMLAVRKLWFIALILVVWWLVTALGLVPAYKLPSPGDVLGALENAIRERELLGALWDTLLRLVTGWAIGVACAVALGLLTGAVPFLEDGIRPVLAGLQAVPTIAFLPLAILWFGFNATAVLVITAFGTFKPMALATYGAIHQVPPTLKMAGRAMGARGLFYQRTLVLPAIVPSLVTGLKLSWSFAWRSLMAAEIIVSGTTGLGGVLELGREINAIDIVMAVILIILVVGILFEQLVFARLERWVNRRWGLVGAR
ncbi:MAG: ABC transporter permease [Thermoleophilia bacterium]|nr:ABC transporter permease [Thermoleophilia bacterium]